MVLLTMVSLDGQHTHCQWHRPSQLDHPEIPWHHMNQYFFVTFIPNQLMLTKHPSRLTEEMIVDIRNNWAAKWQIRNSNMIENKRREQDINYYQPEAYNRRNQLIIRRGTINLMGDLALAYQRTPCYRSKLVIASNGRWNQYMGGNMNFLRDLSHFSHLTTISRSN